MKKSYLLIAILIALASVALFTGCVFDRHSEQDGVESVLEINGVEYIQWPDVGWLLDDKLGEGNRIGYWGNRSTILYEVTGDESRDFIRVTYSDSCLVPAPLIKSDIDLQLPSEKNVSKINFIVANLSSSGAYHLDLLNETNDQGAINAFYSALNDTGTHVDKDDVTIDVKSEIYYNLFCYNKDYPLLYTRYKIDFWNDMLICFNVQSDAYAVIPADTLAQLAGETLSFKNEE